MVTKSWPPGEAPHLVSAPVATSDMEFGKINEKSLPPSGKQTHVHARWVWVEEILKLAQLDEKLSKGSYPA